MSVQRNAFVEGTMHSNNLNLKGIKLSKADFGSPTVCPQRERERERKKEKESCSQKGILLLLMDSYLSME